MSPIRIALVGIGKIARDQHVPAIAGHDGLELVATCSRHASLDGVRSFKDFGEMLRDVPEIDAVSLCTPPTARQAFALEAFEAGKHVILEKPPAATLAELEPLVAKAKQANRTLFATWHSRFADGVRPAREWLADARIERVTVNWKEDVRHWHPGQDWIWEPGGLGVFDPGINALSIVTAILPRPIHLTKGELSFPANRATPIAASLRFADVTGVPVEAEFDWRQTGPQSWDIEVVADKGRLTLSNGGALLRVDGKTVLEGRDREYPGIYAHFTELAASNRSDVDLAPLTLVADAFMLGRRNTVEAFD
ncbi:Gfo/Idh/MocA family protein [Aureimonas leprariae]|uniref:Gfo/Idh/MocA family oxidoreductase n=1 Tax=Plantimonas leprariae TaxID=2615207 RepID=A0A7V7PQQ9_9HYPH|nr:Gfo/Idh/MocA family oxidoreductase [Aureimonas leprariae]KAB0680740.1 Gfo/Idh/MocA family oxidoreductase [Aureimonas leprariae]